MTTKHNHCLMKQTLQWVLGRVNGSAKNVHAYEHQMAIDIYDQVETVIKKVNCCTCHCTCCCKEE